MTKIAHIADTHLGYRQYAIAEREEDYYEAFNNIIDNIIDKNVDYVIHSGDLFEHPKPPVKAIHEAQIAFNKLKEHNIPVYAIAGNHDIMQKSNTIIPQTLLENDNFHMITLRDNHVILDDNIYLCGMPYIHSVKHPEIITEILEKMAEDASAYPYKILMLHGSIEKYFPMNYEFKNSQVPEGFDYYAMGHIHKRVIDTFKGGKLSYPGSNERKSKVEQIDYEKKSKGYNLITIDDNGLNVEFVNIKLEREIIIRTINYTKIDAELTALHSEIEDIIKTTSKKPLVILTIRNGNFERSEVSDKVHEKLDDVSLIIRLEYSLTENLNDDKEELDLDSEKLKPEYYIHNKILNEIGDESVAQLALKLYQSLSENNMEASETLSDEYFKERYQEDENLCL